MAFPKTRRECHVRATAICINDEDVCAGHASTLAHGYPLFRGGPLDLEENVAIAAGRCLFGYVKTVADTSTV